LLVQVFRFAITGFINTMVDFGVFNLLLIFSGTQNPVSIALINSLAVGISIITSYILNKRWTFPPTNRDRQLMRFIVVSVIGVVINSTTIALLAGLNSNVHVSALIFLNTAKILAAFISSAWNFMAYRNWVFRTEESKPAFTNNEPVKGLISIIIPAYNEENRLPSRLQQLAGLIARLPVEIIVVNDGSRDHSKEIIHEFARKYPFIKYAEHKRNLGKGAAVKTGMYRASGEYLIFSDADGTYTPEHIIQVAENLQSGREIVIACRHGQGRARIDGESGWRSLQGKAFNLVVRMLLLPGIKDSQCGLKGFSREAAAQIFPRQRIHGFAFDVELLTLARYLHFSVSKIEVAGTDCQGSTVSHILAPMSMGLDLIRIKLAILFNRYSLPDHPSLAASLAGAGSLFTLALLFRLPWLWEFPRYIDELKEVDLAYQIFLGHAFPLHNMAHDIGALHNYILAAIFKLLGVSIYWPRLYVAVTSALTVVLIYHLGKKLGGKWVGIIAALLLTGNGMHILVTHMAWSNCTTPFFFCLAWLALINAESKGSGLWLAISSFLWALTLQTHSSVIIFILAAIFYIMQPRFRQQAGIKNRSYAWAGLSFIIGYANMIYYNFISRGDSFYWLKYKSYALEQHPTLASYLTNLREMLIELIRSLGSTYQQQVNWGQYLADPWFSLALCLLMVGLYYAYKEKHFLPLYFMAAAFLIMPWINHRYVFFLATRYIMPLILCALLIVALGLLRVTEDVYALLGSKRILRVPAFGILAILMVLQLVPFYAYCRENSGTNQSNRLAMQIFQKTLNISRQEASLVIMDENLSLENNPLPYLFTLVQQPYRVDNPTVLTMAGAMNKNSVSSNSHVENKLVGIISAESFSALRSKLNPEEIDSFSCEVTMPASAHGERKVYVLDLGKYSGNPQKNNTYNASETK
jgi:glycosyltransferase involved in cell wall biosynthesis/putative flippase GtrA